MFTGTITNYEELRTTLDTAEKFIDRGMAQTANEYTLIVIARSLVDIAETLHRIAPHGVVTVEQQAGGI